MFGRRHTVPARHAYLGQIDLTERGGTMEAIAHLDMEIDAYLADAFGALDAKLDASNANMLVRVRRNKPTPPAHREMPTD